MPELPEVHTITHDLKKFVRGNVISFVEIRSGYKVLPGNKKFVDAVAGNKISGIRRIAKNIVMELEEGNAVLVHLAMTGRLLLRQPGFRDDKWERVVFGLAGEKEYELRFCDMRTFGKIELLDAEGLQMLEKKYGPEPLNENLSASDFYNALISKNTNIKNALLDQKIISGMGNIYANDALWMAKIHPETRTADLTESMAERLLDSSREILTEAIKNRGSTLGDRMYIDLLGREGSHQEHFRIYSREVCPECGFTVEFMKLNGRGTFFCPGCQQLNS